MVNLKLTIGSAAFGLMASFLLGLLGGNQFYLVVLRALLSSIIMGGVMAIVSLVYRKFLLEPFNDSANLDGSNSGTGALVDITIGEDVLPDSDNAPDFYVTKDYSKTDNNQENHQKSFNTFADNIPKVDSAQIIKQDSTSDSLDEKPQKGDAKSFIPTPLAQKKNTVGVANNSVSSPEVSNSLNQQSLKNESAESINAIDSLDSLPEINDTFLDIKPQNSEVIEDSAFATGEKTPSADFVPDAVVGADASLMAEAIKTLLKREG